MSANPFTSLSSDTTELILSYLPIPSLLRASSVCKQWHSLITAPTFPISLHHHNRPWFFLHGVHNTSSKNNQSFAFDPSSNSWFLLPSSPFPSPDVTGSNGFLFCTAPCFSFSAVLKPRWKSTSPFRFSRISPLLGVFYDDDWKKNTSPSTSMPKFIVVGGVRFIGGLVDIEDRLAVEIYDPATDSWDLCPPLPVDFRSGYSSQTLSSALFKDRFFVFGIYTFFVSSFDLEKRVWSQVQTLRPPGVVFAFLITCQEMFVLAGVCSGPHGPSFNLWRIDEKNLEFSEIAIMPQDLLYGLVDGEEDDGNKFGSLKCVGMGCLIYVFNEEYHKKYPACVCEISTSDSGKCSWRRVPKLPSPVNKFHKVISFCSTVLPHNVFGGEEEEIGMVVAGY